MEMEIEIETASRNGPFWFFGGQSCQSRVVSDPVRVKISDAFERLVSLAFREKTFDKKARPRVTRRVTTYPARAQARPEQVLLRIVQADPTHFFVWCFAGGDAFRSAARADSRAIVSRKRRHGMSTRVARWANRVVWGVSEGSLVFAARARDASARRTSGVRHARLRLGASGIRAGHHGAEQAGLRVKMRRTALVSTRDATRGGRASSGSQTRSGASQSWSRGRPSRRGRDARDV
jgi:hypothetical protein